MALSPGGMDRGGVVLVLTFAAIIVGLGAWIFSKFMPSGQHAPPPERRPKESDEERGVKRPASQLPPEETAELEKRRRRAEAEKAIRAAEDALPK